MKKAGPQKTNYSQIILVSRKIIVRNLQTTKETSIL